jgi:hypothetical protein
MNDEHIINGNKISLAIFNSKEYIKVNIKNKLQ